MKVLACLLAVVALPALGGEIAPGALDRPASFAGADVVILGEVHDNPLHHAHQARAVAALQPRALVFEMLSPDIAGLPVPRGDVARVAKALGWDSKGWPDFALYHPILLAAPGARIYGAEVPRSVARQALKTGIAEAFGKAAQAYGLTTPLSAPGQAAREAEQAQAHCLALPGDVLPGMVAVQRLRDAVLARAVVQAMAETGGPVAVITGLGHARRDQGLAVPLARVAADLRLLSLGQFEEAAPAAPAFDLWLVTPAAPREDPCKALKG